MINNTLTILTSTLEKLEKDMNKIANSGTINVTHETQVHQALDNALNSLYNNNQWLDLLAIKDKSDIEDFINQINEKNAPSWWAHHWGTWAYEVQEIVAELKGTYIFNKKTKSFTYYLRGKDLILDRVSNQYYPLTMTLPKVGTVEFNVPPHSAIEVTVKDLNNNIMATWKEFKQTVEVKLVRKSPIHFKYAFVK